MAKNSKRNSKENGAHAAVVEAPPAVRLGQDCKYKDELCQLQLELVKLQEWVRHKGLKVAVIFEGRDAAGKGGAIKRITECLNPRICRVVALGTPTEKEKTQWYFQRYVSQLPAGGEIVLFDRSWYNRAGVEHVMGFCTDSEYLEFLHSCPAFEQMLVRSGIILVKYWFSVSDEEQERRFQERMHDQTKRWKLSPDGPGVAAAMGGVFARQRRDVRPHRHQAGAVVRGECGQQEESPAQCDPALAFAHRLRRPDARTFEAAAAGKSEVHSAADAQPELHSRSVQIGVAPQEAGIDFPAAFSSRPFSRSSLRTERLVGPTESRALPIVAVFEFFRSD